jgi:hypothetical protein
MGFYHLNGFVLKKMLSLQHHLKYKRYMSDIDDIIMGGMVFKGGGGGPKKDDDDKVKTKAKKKKYITGAHGSGSARQKAKYRQQRANRKSQKKK